jgi:hypothetical protein
VRPPVPAGGFIFSGSFDLAGRASSFAKKPVSRSGVAVAEMTTPISSKRHFPEIDKKNCIAVVDSFLRVGKYMIYIYIDIYIDI